MIKDSNEISLSTILDRINDLKKDITSMKRDISHLQDRGRSQEKIERRNLMSGMTPSTNQFKGYGKFDWR